MFWPHLSNAALLVLLVLLAKLGGPPFSLLEGESPGGSALLGSTPSILTAEGARWELNGSGHWE